MARLLNRSKVRPLAGSASVRKPFKDTALYHPFIASFAPELHSKRPILMEDMFKPHDILGLFMANVRDSRAFVTGTDEAAGFQSIERYIAAECTACG